MLDKTRDLLVLGASNEIMTKSYIKHLSGRKVINASVGGSGSLAGIAMLGMHSIPEGGYCLMNYELPEHGIIQSGIRTEREIRDIWKTMIDQIWSRNACPIIVTLPRQEGGKLVRSSTCDLHVSIAEDYGIPYFDGSRLFVTLCEGGISPDDLMVDVAHLSDKSHKILGEALNATLTQFDSVERTRRTITYQASPFHLIWAKDLDLGESVQKQSSLSKASMRNLRAGDQIELALPGPGFEFVAISINRMSLGAALNAPGFCKHFIYDQAGLAGFMRVIVDVRARTVDGENALFTISPLESADPTETTVYLRKQPKILECGLEVECFIFRDTKPRATEGLPHDYLALPDFDLLNALGDDFMETTKAQFMNPKPAQGL